MSQTATRRQGFSARHRLTGAPAFDRVLRSRWRARKQFFSVHCAPNDCQYPRLGLIVARRLAGNSVKRNAVKRLVREVFRMRQGDIAGWDWVVRLTSLPGPNQWDQARRELQAMFTVRS